MTKPTKLSAAGEDELCIRILHFIGVLIVVLVICIVIFQFGRNYERLNNAEKVCAVAINGDFVYWVGDDITCERGGGLFIIGYTIKDFEL